MEKYYNLVFALYRQVLSAKVNGDEISPEFNRDALKEIACEITKRKIMNEPTDTLCFLMNEIRTMTDIIC